MKRSWMKKLVKSLQHSAIATRSWKRKAFIWWDTFLIELSNFFFWQNRKQDWLGGTSRLKSSAWVVASSQNRFSRGDKTGAKAEGNSPDKAWRWWQERFIQILSFRQEKKESIIFCVWPTWVRQHSVTWSVFSRGSFVFFHYSQIRWAEPCWL